MKTSITPGSADYKKFSDEELAYRFHHRHENIAMEHLCDRYGHLVLGIFMKYFDVQVAKEKTEHFFVTLADVLKKKEVDHFKLWIYNYVEQLCIEESQGGASNVYDAIKNDGTGFTSNDVTDEVVNLVEDGMKNLNKEQQELIALFYLEGLTYLQIAKQKNLTPSAVKSIIQTGIQQLKK